MITFYDYYLRGDTEADVHAGMAAAGIPLGPTHATSYDTIGTIYVDDAPIAGWHANLRLRAPMTDHQEAGLASVLIPPPHHPARVWA
jgi:hypothetical protein